MRRLAAAAPLLAALLASAPATALRAGILAPPQRPEDRAASGSDSLPPSSAAWLALLPEGEEKRRFVLDCTGCHQFDERIARPAGRARTQEEWDAAVKRMLGYAGARTGFPVISAHRDTAATAAWLARHLQARPTVSPVARTARIGKARVIEYPMPVARDLPHDVAVDSGGRIVITGMFTDRMFVLDPRSGALDTVPIPVERANPRAVELDAQGRWWVVLGAPGRLARYTPSPGAGAGTWESFDVGFYAHSVAVGRDGTAWANAHFSKDPELLASVDAKGTVRKIELPRHPAMAAVPGGPIPYEVRVAPDGRVWTSELQGNRLLWHDPATSRNGDVTMPVSHMGPRRFDIARDGVLWIPAYAANELVRYDPARQKFERHALPVSSSAPYVVRLDEARGRVWIGTGAADAILSFDRKTRAFTVYPLPSRGALVRHLAVDPRSGDLWIAYGGSPGIAARIARLSVGS